MTNNNKTLTIGDVVKIRDDLKLGLLYFNNDGTYCDEISEMMLNNLGKEAYIINVVKKGVYQLCIDNKNDVHKYVDEMLIQIVE